MTAAQRAAHNRLQTSLPSKTQVDPLMVVPERYKPLKPVWQPFDRDLSPSEQAYLWRASSGTPNSSGDTGTPPSPTSPNEFPIA